MIHPITHKGLSMLLSNFISFQHFGYLCLTFDHKTPLKATLKQLVSNRNVEALYPKDLSMYYLLSIDNK